MVWQLCVRLSLNQQPITTRSHGIKDARLCMRMESAFLGLILRRYQWNVHITHHLWWMKAWQGTLIIFHAITQPSSLYCIQWCAQMFNCSLVRMTLSLFEQIEKMHISKQFVRTFNCWLVGCCSANNSHEQMSRSLYFFLRFVHSSDFIDTYLKIYNSAYNSVMFNYSGC